MSQCHDAYAYDFSGYPGPEEEPATDMAPSCHDSYESAASASRSRKATPSRGRPRSDRTGHRQGSSTTGTAPVGSSSAGSPK